MVNKMGLTSSPSLAKMLIMTGSIPEKKLLNKSLRLNNRNLAYNFLLQQLVRVFHLFFDLAS